MKTIFFLSDSFQCTMISVRDGICVTSENLFCYNEYFMKKNENFWQANRNFFMSSLILNNFFVEYLYLIPFYHMEICVAFLNYIGWVILRMD